MNTNTQEQAATFNPVKKRDIAAPADGVYDDMPAEEYHRIDALNASLLKAFSKSGIHGEHELRKPPAGSEALWFGQAFHSAVLEPDDYESRVHTFEQTGIGASADVAHRKYLEAHPDSIPMREGWEEKIDAMAYRIRKHPDCPYLLTGCEGKNELTLIWRAEMIIDGDRVVIPCKARIDRYASNFTPYAGADPVQGLIDIKTCQDSSVHGFETAIGRYMYHIQSAWYLAGAIHLGLVKGLHDNAYTFIAVEKAAPHPVGVYPMNTASLQYGVEECKRAMKEYVKYRMHGHAQGPTDYKVTMGIPAWAMPADAGQ